jgi:hypothetical protein
LGERLKIENVEEGVAAYFQLMAKSGETYTLGNQGWDTDFKKVAAVWMLEGWGGRGGAS